MYIYKTDVGRPIEAPEYDRATAARDLSSASKPKSQRGDRVEISGSAKALAEQYASEGLSAGRIGIIRQQIAQGVYPAPEAVEELAWRLIEAGIV